jgi:hypothetical protein
MIRHGHIDTINIKKHKTSMLLHIYKRSKLIWVFHIAMDTTRNKTRTHSVPQGQYVA